jgi:hypothetical protein
MVAILASHGISHVASESEWWGKRFRISPEDKTKVNVEELSIGSDHDVIQVTGEGNGGEMTRRRKERKKKKITHRSPMPRM